MKSWWDCVSGDVESCGLSIEGKWPFRVSNGVCVCVCVSAYFLYVTAKNYENGSTYDTGYGI